MYTLFITILSPLNTVALHLNCIGASISLPVLGSVFTDSRHLWETSLTHSQRYTPT